MVAESFISSNPGDRNVSKENIAGMRNDAFVQPHSGEHVLSDGGHLLSTFEDKFAASNVFSKFFMPKL